MRLSLIIGALLISIMAWASFEDSYLFKEFDRRSKETPDLFSKKVIKALEQKGVENYTIQAITSDKTTGVFSYDNLNDERCSGTFVNNVLSETTCVSKWTAWEQKVLSDVYQKVPKEEILQFEGYEQAGKFVFETVRKEICHGDFIIGKASFFCYSKAGIMTFFGGGDAD